MEANRAKVRQMLQGIHRYNPENIPSLEFYVDVQSKENGYDLEANLTLLKLYQSNPKNLQLTFVCQVLVKALTNLPHSDFILCKCLLSQETLMKPEIITIQKLASLLETCRFKEFWNQVQVIQDIVRLVTGFEDSIRRFVCHVISITYQRIRDETIGELLGLVDESSINKWIERNGWTQSDSGYVIVSNQEEMIKNQTNYGKD
ncbi:EIF3K [Lepeophtheirus salmonis]|uniref:Eukaryotic translation initiation factor 3 subunit K n=1 Tax=Lepeophtheirus salmonis TaxID=72036 RepID=A0A7R8CNH9_LEPSM|nr:EIF3K [Lepeophtheirus salmonis]CAF2846250.1 EIF3K [Lepeophtheirus salmonis]